MYVPDKLARLDLQREKKKKSVAVVHENALCGNKGKQVSIQRSVGFIFFRISITL